ncbi:hypothetical protein FBY05_12562 [Pseudomonas sp. SJZ083]|jgi:hypothetical protein|nr:hypothetical protein FBY05_12562 [Pseudomonas sp. SJZ083]TWC43292.1 hypothetical protein FBY01_12529 [Pseudomonas sp. SJZ077]
MAALCGRPHGLPGSWFPEPMFLANPKYDTESLLAIASESLGSASVAGHRFIGSIHFLVQAIFG